MNYEEFLSGCTDETLRLELWDVFQKAESRASMLVDPSVWVSITVVTQSTKNTWFDGKIWLAPEKDDWGRIYHEVFHSAFDRSVLHDGSTDEEWGDAFCDAFRYFMEFELDPLKTSEWFTKIDSFCGKTLKEVLNRPGCGCKKHDKQYGYPASRIIHESGKDYGEFCKLWQKLTAKRKQASQPILNNHFKYDFEKDLA
jgi:hypothetical protein